MNDALIGGGLVVMGWLLAQLADVIRRRSMRRTLAIALAEEVGIVHRHLSELAEKLPTNGMAHTIDAFFRQLCEPGTTGELFRGLLPQLNVLPTSSLSGLANLYLKLQLERTRARGVLDRGGSVTVSTGETDPIWQGVPQLVEQADAVHRDLMRIVGNPMMSRLGVAAVVASIAVISLVVGAVAWKPSSDDNANSLIQRLAVCDELYSDGPYRVACERFAREDVERWGCFEKYHAEGRAEARTECIQQVLRNRSSD